MGVECNVIYVPEKFYRFMKDGIIELFSRKAYVRDVDPNVYDPSGIGMNRFLVTRLIIDGRFSPRYWEHKPMFILKRPADRKCFMTLINEILDNNGPYELFEIV